ncbi:MAG: MarR family winged helix-turn-helix transcriptional regulator [Pseudonocardia sp.]
MTRSGEPVHDNGGPALNRVLAQVERLLTRRIEAVLSSRGMTIDQWRVVDLLADGEGHPMSEIAAAIVVPGPTLTKIVDRLVDAATVYRLVDSRDRRRVLAFLSDDGRALHTELAPRVADIEQAALATLPDGAPGLLDVLDHLAREPLAREPATSARAR